MSFHPGQELTVNTHFIGVPNSLESMRSILKAPRSLQMPTEPSQLRNSSQRLGVAGAKNVAKSATAFTDVYTHACMLFFALHDYMH